MFPCITLEGNASMSLSILFTPKEANLHIMNLTRLCYLKYIMNANNSTTERTIQLISGQKTSFGRQNVRRRLMGKGHPEVAPFTGI